MELELLHLLGVSKVLWLDSFKEFERFGCKTLTEKTVPCLGQQRGRALVGGECGCGSSVVEDNPCGFHRGLGGGFKPFFNVYP